MKIAIAQIAPVWLNREETLEKILQYINQAGRDHVKLLVFGEALLPGYPFWLELTDGARFNAPVQKEIHAHYLQQAVQIEAGHLTSVCEAAANNNMAIYLGCIERPQGRGGHSIYASLVYIDPYGKIGSVHRKLQPTYEERLTWAPGDGHGLRTHKLGHFTLGGLNCWENWMPLPRATLYAMGENVHVAVWPGSVRNTEDITRFIAKEGRSYVISASSLMRKSDFPDTTPHLAKILANAPEVLADGGSCVAAPDGTWIVPPVIEQEGLITAELDYDLVLKERQNFDPSGHYSRPDITRLQVNRERQGILKVDD